MDNWRRWVEVRGRRAQQMGASATIPDTTPEDDRFIVMPPGSANAGGYVIMPPSSVNAGGKIKLP